MKIIISFAGILLQLLFLLPNCAFATTTFDIWYGSNQSFADLGEPQKQVNILGNVSDTDGLNALTYTLNGGSEFPLTLGPSPSVPKRLVGNGDFNVELKYSDLTEGQNTVLLKATDTQGNQTSVVVTVNYTSGNFWPLPYSIDWSSVSNMQDVSQILDGHWSLGGNGITTLEPGYDRLIAIGDISWTNYEVTTTATVNGIDPVCVNDINDCRGNPAVGVVIRWVGHHDWDGGSVQPVIGYFPIGAAGSFKYNRSDLLNGKLRLEGGEFQTLSEDTSRDLPFGVPYILKLRAETIPTVGHFYSLKMWVEGESEPTEWDLVGQEPLTSSSLSNGSVVLVAHNVDATFSNVSVVPITQATGPVAVDDLDAATTFEGIAVNTINVLTNDTLVDNAAISSFDNISIGNGSVQSNDDGTFQYTPTTGFLGTDTFTYTLTDDDGESSTATVTLTVVSSTNPSGAMPDTFSGGSLDTGLWTAIDPVGDTLVNVSNGQLSIAVPASVNHSVWNDGNLGSRVMQSVSDADFDIVAKFDNQLSGRYQSQGILVSQDSDNFIRFDFYQNRSGATTRIFAATFTAGSPTQQVKTEIAGGEPQYLRVTRNGNQWTQYYSYDGVTWLTAVIFTHDVVVSSIGLFAANYDSSSSEYTVFVDEFTVMGVNNGTPPSAVDDPSGGVTLEDVSTNTINVLSNDTIVDNAIISAYDVVSINGGTVSSNGDGTFAYTPENNFNGSDSFTYTLTDDDFESSTATVTVSVSAVNDGAPLAVDDLAAATTIEDSPVNTINVLTNDTLNDNAVISTFDTVSLNGGTLASNGDGTFLYTPASGFSGSDSFTYTLTDDDSENSTATVTLSVTSTNNGIPIAVDDLTAASTPEGISVNTIDVLSNDTLVDNALIGDFDALSVSGGVVSYNGDGTFNYTPVTGYIGSDSFTYTLTDDDNESSTATVTLSVYSGTNPSGVSTDGFNGGSLDSGLWTVIDPLGDATVSVSNGLLSIALPAGVEHSIWKNGNLAVRIMQTSNDTDFDVVAKFNTQLSGRYQSQGVLVEQDDDNYIRFDFYQNRSGATTRIFAATFTDGTPKQKVKLGIPEGEPLYLRITRVGDQWTEYYSYDGQAWVTAASFVHELAVHSVGLFAANYDTKGPEYTVLIDEFIVTESNLPPSAVDDPLAGSTLEDTSVNTIDVLSNDTLVDNANISSYDAVSINGGTVSSNGDGTFLYTPSQNFNGLDSFTYTLTDDDAESSTATATLAITAVNDGSPVAVDDPNSATTEENTSVTITNILTNDTLVDNTVVITFDTVSINGGEVADNGDGTFQYTPPNGFNGPDSFTYTLSDDEAETSTGTVTVTVTSVNNGIPLAVDDVDAATTQEGAPVNTLNVLSNDTLVDNAVISTFDSSSTNGGAVADNGDGTFLYTPLGGFIGSDSFTYTLTDDELEISTATVTVTVTTVNNGAPVAADDPDAATTLEDTAVTTINVLTNDTLFDNAVISAFDSLSVNGGSVSYNGDGTFQYTPAIDFNGTDSFTYTLTDDNAESSLATVTVSVTSINYGSPVAVDDTDAATTAEDTAVTTINVLTNDTLVDNATVSAFDAASANGGSVSYNGDGTFQYTPANGFNGPDSFTYTLSDDEAETSTGTVTVTVTSVNNGIPLAVDDVDAATTQEGAPVNTLNVLSNDTLVDNAVISTFDSSSTNGGAVADNGDGTFLYTPLGGFIGSDSFTYTLTDDELEISTATVTVTVTTVNNGAPVAADDPDAATTLEDTAVTTINVLTNDTLFDNAVISAFDSLSVNGGSVSYNGDGTFQYTPAIDFNGTDSFTYTLTDDNAESSLATVTVSVTSINYGSPVAVDDTDAATTAEDTAVTTINVLTNDTLVDNATVSAFDAASANGGSVSYNGDGTFQYTPANGFNGSDSFTYTLSDDEAETSIGTVSVIVTSVDNGTPLAVDDGDAATTQEGEAVNTLNVLTNDTLIDHAAISTFDAVSENGGTVTYNGNGTFLYTPANGFSGTDSFSYTLTDDELESSSALVVLTVLSSGGGNPANLTPDNFNSGSLNTSIWTVVDPVGDSSISMTGSQFSISVPAGVEHSTWHNGNLSSRIIQPVTDADFDVMAKFDSELSGRYQSQGIFVEQDSNNYIRFDFYQDKTGSTTRIFAATFSNSSPTQQVKFEIASGGPFYLRVTRVGNQWSQYFSFDGTNWVHAITFDHTLLANYVGLFAGNYDVSSDAYTVLIDDFLLMNGTVNTPPVAVDDLDGAITTENTSVMTVNVLLNDLLIDNAVISSFDEISSNGGSVSNNGDGTFTYTPVTDFVGADSFTYTLTDDENESSTATVTLLVNTVLIPVVELSSLNGINGVTLNGVAATDNAGYSVSGAGDINADGVSDIVIGARYVDANGVDSGASYVVFGTTATFNPVIELANLDGINGFVINGGAPEDRFGNSVSAAGDVNGDGIDDLVVGAPRAETEGKNQLGAVYVIFGKNTSFSPVFDVSGLDGNNGFVLHGINSIDQAGYSVSEAGDVNGDGFDDIIIGAFLADPHGSQSGEAYIVFGAGAGFPSSFDLADLDGSNGVVINGIAESDRAGHSVGGAGDVNGDGFDDVIIGAYLADSMGLVDSGESYVVFGKGSPFDAVVELSSLDGSNGFVLNGAKASDYAGRSVGAGDVNGDGFGDILIGAYRADPNGQKSGESYIVFGKAGTFNAAIPLSSLDGNNGFVIEGVNADDLSGRWGNGAGDVNGDGIGDIVISSIQADPNGIDSGSAYVIYGAVNYPSNLKLSSLDGSNGYVINGVVSGDGSGQSVVGAGDVNGDGFDDLVIGAYKADPNGTQSGQSYIVFGRP